MTTTDPEVLGYLGRALSLELSAVQLYATQARLVASWGLAEPERRFERESREEMAHVDRIIARMLALGVAPGASVLRPAGLGTDLKALLEFDLAFEQELVALYYQAACHCAARGSSEDRLFFQNLMEEEQSHAADLESWIEELERMPEAPVGHLASY